MRGQIRPRELLWMHDSVLVPGCQGVLMGHLGLHSYNGGAAGAEGLRDGVGGH